MSVFEDPALFSEFQATNNCSDDGNSEDHDSDEEINTALQQYQLENQKLREENDELRRTLRIITQPENIKVKDSQRDGPVAHVLLFNNTFSSRFQVESVKDFFRCVSSKHTRQNDHNPISAAPQLSSFHFPPRQIKDYKKPFAKESRRTPKAFVVTRSLQIYDENFYLDQIGEPLQDNSTSNFLIPEYERARLDPLDGDTAVPESDQNSYNKIGRMCFNCGMKDHQLKDCPSPKDFKSINQRRQQFMDKISNSPQAGVSRYHADKEIDENDPRFADFKPGVVSEALRVALGMGRKDLPPYIYQMRLLRYPPGHMQDATSPASGLSMYNGDKSHTDESDVDIGEGFVDIEKIIDYPGFNTDPPKNIRDNYRERQAMPMDQRDSKEVMLSYHKHKNELLRRKMSRQSDEQTAAKRRRLNNKNDDSDSRHGKPPEPKVDDTTEVDMEIGGESPTRECSKQDDDVKKVLFVESPMPCTPDPQEDGEIEDGEIDEDSRQIAEDESREESSALQAEEQGASSDVVVASPEEDKEAKEEELSGVDAGNLSEEELEVMRENILKKLQEEMRNGKRPEEQEVVEISSENEQEVISVSSSSEEETMRRKGAEEEVIVVDSAGQDSQEELGVREEVEDPLLGASCGETSDLADKGPSQDDLPLKINDAEDFVYRDSPMSPDEDVPHRAASTTLFRTTSHNDRDYRTFTGRMQLVPSPTSENTSASLQDAQSTGDESAVKEIDSELLASDDIPKSPNGRGETPVPVTANCATPSDGALPETEKSEHPDRSMPETEEIKPADLNATHDSPAPMQCDGAATGPDSFGNSPYPGATPSPDAETGVPHRSNFAKGVARFDAYYVETESRGVYKKLRGLLKNSPIQKAKKS